MENVTLNPKEQARLQVLNSLLAEQIALDQAVEFMGVSTCALPQQNRYPTQVIASNKMLLKIGEAIAWEEESARWQNRNCWRRSKRTGKTSGSEQFAR